MPLRTRGNPCDQSNALFLFLFLVPLRTRGNPLWSTVTAQVFVYRSEPGSSVRSPHRIRACLWPSSKDALLRGCRRLSPGLSLPAQVVGKPFNNCLSHTKKTVFFYPTISAHPASILIHDPRRILLRGTIVNRTHGIHKNPYTLLCFRTILGPIYHSPP